MIQAARCFQHFEEVLNRPDFDEPVDPEPSDNIAINTGPTGFPSRSSENNQGNEELVMICLLRFGNTCMKSSLKTGARTSCSYFWRRVLQQ